MNDWLVCVVHVFNNNDFNLVLVVGGSIALIKAAESGSDEMICELLRSGADVNEKNKVSANMENVSSEIVEQCWF